MSNHVVLTLNWPDPRLNPNRKSGAFWGVSHAAKKTARELAYVIALAQQGILPASGPLAAVISLQPPDARKRDVDNVLASLKPTLDGIAAALGYDDGRVREYHIHMDAPYRPHGQVQIAIHPGERP